MSNPLQNLFGKRVPKSVIRENLVGIRGNPWAENPNLIYVTPENLIWATGGTANKRGGGPVTGTVVQSDGRTDVITLPWNTRTHKIWFDLKARRWHTLIPDAAEADRFQHFRSVTEWKIKELTGKGW